MLGDMVYETARSANSQYFNILGISATTVGLVFGIDEFLGLVRPLDCRRPLISWEHFRAL